MTDASHQRYMRTALALARRHLGQTWPNPAVGAVIVHNGRIIGTGSTARGGRPHAETEALAQAGVAARGGTIYVTLEPCSHHGKTPPCVDAIIAAGIAACVIAVRDPNPQVNGNGIAQLQAAGIKVVEGVCAQEAMRLNEGFFSVIQKKRPFIALKFATSIDGKITTGNAKQPWLTGEAARGYGHLLRSRYDAIATGIGTVLADNPLLTCRLPGLEDCSPVRVVFDRHSRLPKESQLMKTAKDMPVWSMAQPTLEEALAELTKKGITRLLVEGGQKLSSAFLAEGLADRIYWFRAPITVGPKGMPALTEDFPADLSALPGWKIVQSRDLPPDWLDVLER